MTLLRATLGLLVVLAIAAPGSAQSMIATWYTMSLADPDFGTLHTIGTYGNEVLANIGPNGLPVYNPSYGGAQAITDLLGTNEITWWSPANNSHLTATGTTTVTLPYSNLGMFPVNGGNSNEGDSQGFQTAVFSGTMNVPSPEIVTFNLGADDDAFLYVDGQLVVSLGGYHALSTAPVSTATLSAGAHSITLFYADIQHSGAALNFSLSTAGVSITPPNAPLAVPALTFPAAAGLALLLMAAGWIVLRRAEAR